MIQMGLIKVAMDMLYKPESCITRLLVMLLVNLTQLDDGVSSLLQVVYLYRVPYFLELISLICVMERVGISFW